MRTRASGRVRIGVLRLADSAPVMLAAERGLFAGLGLEAVVSIEPSWANVADKLTYGLLDAAVMLPPLALAATLGLGRPPARLVVPMGISLGGNTIVVAGEAAAALAGETGGALALGRRFAEWLRTRPEPPRFAVVHDFSTHNLLLRYWLAAAGADPDATVRTVVVPPVHVVEALAQGRIVGFCAGAPWGAAAERAGAGRVLLGTGAIWRNHPEKCLAVAAGWAEANPATLTALLRALLRAGRACDAPEEAGAVAALLASQQGLALPEAATRTALGEVTFHAGAAWFPWRSQADWFLGQMGRWGWAGGPFPGVADALYRPDLLRPALAAEGLPWPVADRKQEGGHESAWTMPAEPGLVDMQADAFVSGAVFTPNSKDVPSK